MRGNGNPIMVDTSILDLTESDRSALFLELTDDQIKSDLSSPTMQWFVAEVKRRLRLNQDAFFSGGMGLPAGLGEASPREAYCVGLVSFGRLVLGLVEELRAVGNRPIPKPDEPVVDPFSVGVHR